jgi:uncharacterized alkaline shock family protein YloU
VEDAYSSYQKDSLITELDEKIGMMENQFSHRENSLNRIISITTAERNGYQAMSGATEAVSESLKQENLKLNRKVKWLKVGIPAALLLGIFIAK